MLSTKNTFLKSAYCESLVNEQVGKIEAEFDTLLNNAQSKIQDKLHYLHEMMAQYNP